MSKGGIYQVFEILDGSEYDVVKVSPNGEVESIYRYTEEGCECPDYKCRVLPGLKKNCKHERVLICHEKGLEMISSRSDLNKATLTGYLVKDPVMRKTRDDKSVTNFTIAANEFIGLSDDGEPKKIATYVTCTTWNRKAEIVKEFAKKGTRVLVEGRLRQNQGNQNRLFLLIGEDQMFEVIANGVRR